MFNILSNVFAVIRGNIKCLISKLFNKNCIYSPIVRMFSHSKFQIEKGTFSLGKGVTFCERTSCIVRKGAKLKLGNMVYFNSDCKIICRKSISIGDNTIFGPNVYIYDHDHVFDAVDGVKRKEFKCSDIAIGKNCWIGAGTIILRGTQIGDNCVIGGGSVVKGKYCDDSLIIQSRNEKIKRMDD